jgi:hypothetical protein
VRLILTQEVVNQTAITAKVNVPASVRRITQSTDGGRSGLVILVQRVSNLEDRDFSDPFDASAVGS